MSDPVGADDLVYVAQAHVPQKEIQAVDEKKEPHIPINEKETTVVSTVPSIHNVHDDGREYPTEEEERTLRRVSDSVSWTAYTVAFVELCERFSYYGTTAVCRFSRRLLKAVSNLYRCQLYSAASSRRLHHGCRIQWTVRCSGPG